jgi:hypothetical protein
VDDFLLFNEYISQHENEWIEDFCKQWGGFILTDADEAELEKIPEEQRSQAKIARLTPELLPIWLFLGALCHVLQEEENSLTPRDAFWLGLIDEVAGLNLPTLRRLMERAPKPEPSTSINI